MLFRSKQDELVKNPNRRDNDATGIVSDVEDFIALPIAAAEDIQIRVIPEQVPLAFPCRATESDVDPLRDFLGPSGLSTDQVQAVQTALNGRHKQIITIDRRFENWFWKLGLPNLTPILGSEPSDGSAGIDRDDGVAVVGVRNSLGITTPEIGRAHV